ncbi:hypothetical protein [Vulgatibacter incomptus]|uniref:DUF2059 domain-containing protein n=1 Tax=Vulgatibacter incomptus TaxID=1391653 RepID=A0A0K1PCQ9_9BACT|nr:hypothetical protein [Vulgatibacter incomptus]AKU90904.1 hypothetical protein AKJ08_1291 [Vulgatibacter incomptus]
MLRTFSSLAAAAAVALLLPATASAQDWASSVYSEGGVELRIDERIFTLFAAFNDMGLDDAPVTRQDPIPKREFDPVRRQVRDAILMSPDLRAKFEAFFDKNPLPVRTYAAYTLALGDAPTFTAPAKLPVGTESLKGFEALLAEFYGKARIKEIFAKLTAPQREVLKRFSPAVDKPVAEARAVMKTKETDASPQVVVVVNLLDGRGSAHGIQVGDEIFLVVGPAAAGTGPVDSLPIARAFARAELEAIAKGKGSALKGGKELLREVQGNYAVGSASVEDYVAENLARVVAIKAAVPSEEMSKAMEDEMRNGFLLVRELNRGMAIYAKATKPLDAFIADFLREIDVGKLPRL